MIETKPLVWEALFYHERFPCFIWGCQEEAGYLAKIKHGEAIVEVCLCSRCQRKSSHAILKGLGLSSMTRARIKKGVRDGQNSDCQ